MVHIKNIFKKICSFEFLYLRPALHQTREKKKPMIGSHLVGDHLRHDYGIIPREGDSLYKTIEQM